MGRFISADGIVQAPMDPQTLNRYTYVRNNPVIYTDPTGHIFGIDDFIIGAIIGAVIGGVSSGIQSDWDMEAVGWGALAGGLSGGTLATPASTLGSFGGLAHLSAGASLGSQVAGAAGWADGADIMQQTAMWSGIAFTGWNVGVGIKDWAAAESKYYQISRNGNMTSGVPISKSDIVSQYGKSGAKTFTNGVGMDIHEAMNMAANQGADILHYNPTHGMIADMVESTLGVLTHTDSLGRDLGGLMTQVRLDMVGYSQGTIIGSNAMIYAGLKGGAVSGSTFAPFGKAVGMGRFAYSSHMAGVNMLYGSGKTSPFDVIRLISSEANPLGYVQGAIGLVTGVGFQQHTSY